MLSTDHKRILLFLGLCIPARIGLVFLAKMLPNQYLPYMGAVTLIPAMAFLIIYLFDLRKTGMETFNQPIWWNQLRPVHSILYGSFSYMAYNQHKYSYIPIAIDTILGLCSFLYYHSS